MNIEIIGQGIYNIYKESMMVNLYDVFTNGKLKITNASEDEQNSLYSFDISAFIYTGNNDQSTISLYNKSYTEINFNELSEITIPSLKLTLQQWNSVFEYTFNSFSLIVQILLFKKHMEEDDRICYYPNGRGNSWKTTDFAHISYGPEPDKSGLYCYFDEGDKIEPIRIEIPSKILSCNELKIPIKPNISNNICGAVKFNNTTILPRATLEQYGDLYWIYDTEYVTKLINQEWSISLEDPLNENRFITFQYPGIFTHYSYLIKGDQKLPIKFNEKVSGFKYNYVDSTISTLGSKYPFIRRNGQQSHITFTIEGLISYEADDLSEFCDIKDNPFIDEYLNNILKEKQYRQAVIDFLHSGETMIFSSPTEGNIIVRLSNVSLTPNEKLDRKIWTFSAQATQVADSTFANLEKYDQELEREGKYLQEYKETGEVGVS